jgi:hypothetical protein
MSAQPESRDRRSEIYAQIKEYLGELFDEPIHDEADGHIYVRYGSTVLEISVDPYGPEEVAVEVMAYCAQNVTLDEQLLLGLLELNHQLPFGAFSLVDNDVFFSYSLFGRNLDRHNLLGAIAAVATVSDDYDDRIVARFGGQTALARIQDTGGKHKRRASL